jgi:hypothetical protein
VRKIQEPTVHPDESAVGGEIYRHPAYAQIGASRVSGSVRLYGSDFNHQNFVRIRIGQSELHRSLSNDWPYGGGRAYIEVDVSEAQWATFVSSMNVGLGVQCTLRYKDGEEIPEIAPPKEDRQEQFTAEAHEAASDALNLLDALSEEIEGLKVSGVQKNTLRARVRMARQRLESSIPFVMQQFAEHMEETVEKAKIEVNAYVTGATMRAEVEALARDGHPMLGFVEGESK